MNRASTLLKPYLKKFVLRVHPDFFAQNPLQQKTNAESLQKLYALLDNDNNANSSKTPTASTQLTFHDKQQPNLIVNATLGMRPSPWNNVQLLFTLFDKLKIPVDPADRATVQGMIKKQARKTQQRPSKSISDELMEALRERGVSTKSITVDQVLANPLLMMHPKVNQLDYATRLHRCIPALQPERWWRKVPIIVVPEQLHTTIEKEGRGIIVFSEDMRYEDMKLYLDQNLDRKIMESTEDKNKSKDQKK
ncbi:hypothetical protein BCR43DRAFT_487509 [Syncephalastrum racemosum]|uniref:DUF4460 domain-containing protein n=1 Tax=Syncephalastrum racemosum TaxID=13706 RepID=A0A1X2HQX2_SYNRA|nr:hypothetical protein BCR43DRAFT_487509 [Syncephalastrum racemosum]